MRLWSIHPKYLDQKGLVACWREGLLALSVLSKGEYTTICNNKNLGTVKTIKTPYYRHPQLERFKRPDWILALGMYLGYIAIEANKNRGYKFDSKKLPRMALGKILLKEELYIPLTVTQKQLDYEFKHLQSKLSKRDNKKYWENIKECKGGHTLGDTYYIGVKTNPLFKVIEGDIESWEKIK